MNKDDPRVIKAGLGHLRDGVVMLKGSGIDLGKILDLVTAMWDKPLEWKMRLDKWRP